MRRVDVGFLAADDLCQIGFGKKAQGHARAIVEVGRVGDEALACIVDVGDVGFRADHCIAQLLGRQAAQGVVERQRVHEHSAGDVGAVGRKAGVVRAVELLRQRRLAVDGGDLGAQRRVERRLVQARDDLGAGRFEPEVDVVGVHGIRIGRPVLPQPCNGAREQAQHAAHALKVAERGGLLRQQVDQLGVQRVAGDELLGAAIVGRHSGQRVAVRVPQPLVLSHDVARLRFIHSGEQAPADDLDGLVVLGRIDHRGFAGDNAVGLVQERHDRLVLAGVCIARDAVAAEREREHQRGLRRALDSLEQGCEERRQLLAGSLLAQRRHLAQIRCEFIDQDQRRGGADQLAQGVGAGRDATGVAGLDEAKARLASKRVREFAPGRVGANRTQLAAVGGVGVLAVERGDSDRRGRSQLEGQKFFGLCDALQTVHRMCERDQRVRLAAAELRVESKDRPDLLGTPHQARGHHAQRVAQALGRIGVGKEQRRIPVLGRRVAAQHLRQVGGVVALANRALKHIGARLASRIEVGDGGLPDWFIRQLAAAIMASGLTVPLRLRVRRDDLLA